MGLFDFLWPKRRRRSQTSAPRPPRRPGARARRYLETVERYEAIQRRRKAPQTRPRKAEQRAPSDDGERTVEIPRSVQREAQRRFEARQQAERRERERMERSAAREAEQTTRAERRERARQERAEARARVWEGKEAARLLKQRDRAIEEWMRGGLSRAEAEATVDREQQWQNEQESVDYNPRTSRRRSNPEASAALAIAAGILAVRSNPAPRSVRPNPGLSGVVGEIAKDVLKGGLIAAAQEEAKELRRSWRARRRHNPARLEPNHPDPRLRDMSRRFHGVETEILHLDPDQRRPPPVHVVRIGEERATTYRPSKRSERGSADWEHESGDQGPLRRNASGRRILVADERGRVYLVQGRSRMRFDPDRGLVR